MLGLEGYNERKGRKNWKQYKENNPFLKKKWNSRENLGSMTLESCLIYWILLWRQTYRCTRLSAHRAQRLGLLCSENILSFQCSCMYHVVLLTLRFLWIFTPIKEMLTCITAIISFIIVYIIEGDKWQPQRAHHFLSMFYSTFRFLFLMESEQ